jgi:hypothetical protein
MFPWLLVVVMFICVALMWPEGLWANALTFVNTVFAAMVSLNFFEPVAGLMEKYLASYRYTLDFVAQWLLFVISLAVFRSLTDQTSRHAVRFKLPVEQAGRAIFALLTAWVLVCFTTTAMHTAPLSRSPFRGSFQQEPMSNNFFGTAPDRMLLGFVRQRSMGALSGSNTRPFDEQGDYIVKYGARRQSLKEHNAAEGALRIRR